MPARVTRVGRQVDGEVAVDEVRGRVRIDVGAGPPEHGLDPEYELPRAERLGDVVVGAHGQAQDPVVLLAAGGDHDDRQRGAVGPQLTKDLDAVEARQHQVQQHEVRWVLAGTYQRGVAVGDLRSGAAPRG